mmetsp:Transcript_24086/g.57418  ORF Transcript_24086/g.57418 Transcript_24086/m.57418 type:complete len:311 (-) Transcript_24086:677-1609(-)
MEHAMGEAACGDQIRSQRPRRYRMHGAALGGAQRPRLAHETPHPEWRGAHRPWQRRAHSNALGGAQGAHRRSHVTRTCRGGRERARQLEVHGGDARRPERAPPRRPRPPPGGGGSVPVRRREAQRPPLGRLPPPAPGGIVAAQGRGDQGEHRLSGRPRRDGAPPRRQEERPRNVPEAARGGSAQGPDGQGRPHARGACELYRKEDDGRVPAVVQLHAEGRPASAGQTRPAQPRVLLPPHRQRRHGHRVHPPSVHLLLRRAPPRRLATGPHRTPHSRSLHPPDVLVLLEILEGRPRRHHSATPRTRPRHCG